jgi:hypothetical protein
MTAPIYALLREKPMSLMELWKHYPDLQFTILQDLVEQMVDAGTVGRRFESEIIYYVKGDHGQG